MTNTTHTPAPWVWQDGRLIGDLDGEGLDVISDADARLIAAAPDLLQALHDVDAYLAPEGDEEDVYNYIRAIIKGAISKAQGA
jgi:hypothetical protein